MRTLLVALVVLASCAVQPAVTPTTTPSAPIRPTEAIDSATRTECATRVLSALMTAINAGDVAAVQQLVGSSSTHGFEWVSMSSTSEVGPTLQRPGTHEVDYTPEGARQILLRHSQQSERWALVSVRAGNGPSWHGGVDAELHLERRLADGRTVKTGGKTALSCLESVVYVLSLGDE